MFPTTSFLKTPTIPLAGDAPAPPDTAAAGSDAVLEFLLHPLGAKMAEIASVETTADNEAAAGLSIRLPYQPSPLPKHSLALPLLA